MAKKEERFTIAINGFGRIGKQFFLSCIEHNLSWDIIINEPGDLDFMVYSLKYDSVHHLSTLEVLHDSKNLIVNGKKYKVLHETQVEQLPWKKESVDLVVDCSGLYTEREKASLHIKVGAKKVLLSAPAKNNDITIIPGVNENLIKKEHKIISAGSCTTNCISPMLKVLNDAYKIKSAFFITTHAYTATQKLIDSHDKKDLRRGRAAAQNIVPSTSGASQSVIESIPDLKGKLEGYALRVPVIDGSLVSIIAQVEYKPNDLKQVNILFKKRANEMKQIIQYTEDQIVSSDIIGNKNSCIFDSSLTFVNGNTVSIAGWYDNEIGYSNRLVDVAKLILKTK